jgi:hypothetical protein
MKSEISINNKLYKINIEGDFFWRENEVLFDENSEIIAIAN